MRYGHGTRTQHRASSSREGERSFSFEFFPPKDEAGEEQLWAAIRDAGAATSPTFVSVTYGAGGTTRDTTVAHHRPDRPRDLADADGAT